MTTRKTTKYFRDALAKGFDEAVVTDLLQHYGGEHKEIRGLEPPFQWDHRICGVFLGRGKENKGKLCLDIYWQGDDVDGNYSILTQDLRGRREYVIPAKHYFDGRYTRETHGDIRISRDELADVAAELVKWLSPDAVKARKEQARQQAACCRMRTVIGKVISPKYYDGSAWGRNERYCNGTAALLEYAAQQYAALEGLDDAALAKTAEAVFLANRKDTSAFGRNADRSIAYDLSYRIA